jgi:hypothetical protein
MLGSKVIIYLEVSGYVSQLCLETFQSAGMITQQVVCFMIQYTGQFVY